MTPIHPHSGQIYSKRQLVPQVKSGPFIEQYPSSETNSSENTMIGVSPVDFDAREIILD
jgi:hypothetical protein